MDTCNSCQPPVALDALIDKLKAVFAENDKPDPSKVQSLLSAYVDEGNDDWKQFAMFCPHKYARNLVEFNENFEMIVLCWLPGQESPIHNHSGQNCWMAVLDGNLQEIYYGIESGVLKEGSKQSYFKGQVTHITDEKALHKVVPVNGSGCTLHLYSKPIPLCEIYCPTSGMVTKRKLGFFSKRGTTFEGHEKSAECYHELKKQVCRVDSKCSAQYKCLMQQLD